ncbi:MAG: hypothetical protein NTZ68_01250 [Candidatus Dependentiae bacterium]|nr:hypothetical protein [Candidatus Dependentiae bacterium]
MKNKLMLIGLSIMTADSIVPSVGMFSPTLSTLAAQVSAAAANVYSPRPAYANSKYYTLWAGSNEYLFNEKRAAYTKSTVNVHDEGSYNGAWKSFAHNKPSKTSSDLPKALVTTIAPYTDSYTNLRTDIYENFNKYENSNQNSKSWWKRFFAPLFVGAAVTTKTVIDSKDKTLGEKDTYLVGGTADVDSMNSFPEIVTPAANDIVDKTIANSVFLIDQKQLVAPSNVGSLSSNSRFGYFAHDGKIIATAAVAAFAGLSYATYKAYKNGYFSKFNPFGKTAVVVETPVAQEVKTEPAPVAQAPQKLAVAAQAVKNLNLAAKNKRRPALCPNCHEIH